MLTGAQVRRWRTFAGATFLVVLIAGCSSSGGTSAASSPSSSPTASSSGQTVNSRTVTKDEFGDAWPLQVDSVVLACKPGDIITAESGGVVYGITLEAQEDGAAEPSPIWLVGAEKAKGLGPLQDAGRLLCGDAPAAKAACDLLTDAEVAALAGEPLKSGEPPSIFVGVTGCIWGPLEGTNVTLISGGGDHWLKYLLAASKGSSSVLGGRMGPDVTKKMDEIRVAVAADTDFTPEEGCALYSSLLESQGQAPATQPTVVVVPGSGDGLDRAQAGQCVDGQFTSVILAGGDLSTSTALTERIEAALAAAHTAASA